VKIVIVGGGSAGYMSALQINHKHPDWDITLVDSSKIGILGAGEGTTPVFADTIERLGLPLDEFVRHTGATVKSGLMFVGWGKDKKQYFHPFSHYLDLSLIAYLNKRKQNGLTELEYGYDDFKNDSIQEFKSTMATALTKDKNLDGINLVTQTSLENNVIPNTHSWHIDARKLVEFLNKHSVKRGIRVVDTVVESFSTNSNNEIDSVVIDGESVSCDFLIDATGFKRMFIGEHYGAEWVNTQDTLPCDSAVAFFMDMDNIQPYSEAIAMDYGWAWKTPLQHRWGCGYVYDSKYLSEDDAIQEIKDKFGDDVKIIKKFNFNSGYYSNPWIKNCLAVGLSAGFFEPMEGTAILNSIKAIDVLLDDYLDEYLLEKRSNLIDEYNLRMSTRNEDIKDFLYLHYTTTKTNTDFWKNFTLNNKMPETVKNLFLQAENDLSLYSFAERPGKIFGWSNWITVYTGNELYNIDKVNSLVDIQGELRYTKIVEEIDNNKKFSIPLSTYLDNITNKGE
jgi:tryptophan halogenase